MRRARRLARALAGLELDSSTYPIVLPRTRLLARSQIGENGRGRRLSPAVSF